MGSGTVTPDWDCFCSDPSMWETDFDFDTEMVGGLELRDIMPYFARKHRIRKRVEALKPIQVEIDELYAKFLEEKDACLTKYNLTKGQVDALKATLLEEITSVEAKYNKLYEPLYTQRWQIVNGTVDREEAQSGTLEIPAQDKQCEGVPDFWLKVLKANDVSLSEIQEDDAEVLHFLEDIRWSLVDNPKGFKIEFLFRENHFFKNPVLSKTYHMMDFDNMVPEEAIGTQIDWYQGMRRASIGGRLQKLLKNTKHQEINEKSESFFSFFDPLQVYVVDEINAKHQQSQMEQDFKVGSAIRNEIIPHAIKSFIRMFELEDTDEDSDDAKDPHVVEDDNEGDENDDYIWG